MSTTNPEILFQKLYGNDEAGSITIHSPVHQTPNGTFYLIAPGVVLLARPQVSMQGLAGFLSGFDPSLHFSSYLEDPTPLPDGAQLCKVAGQVCYMSFGPKRTQNDQAKRYFDNLKSSGHGSVFEHANFSLLFYGISRSVTHELIRHRAGFGYCLTGDTLIYSTKWDHGKPSGSKKRRLDDLYAMTKTHHGRSRIKLLRLRCLDEQTGTFTTGKVKSITCSGVKPVFKVTLADGKSITATKEHRFLTEDGWQPLQEIVGSLSVSPSGYAIYEKSDATIMVNGQFMYKDATWLYEHYVTKGLSQEDMASIAGVSKHTIRAWISKHGLQKPLGSWTIGVSPWNTGKQYKTGRVLSEKERAKLSEHMKGENNHRWPRLIPRPVKIVSIHYAGEQMTYDIEMEAPNHNFVANGIITHNSQLSQRYVSGRMLRFVERPEYRVDEQLHQQFLARIERANEEYATLTNRLLEMQQAGVNILGAEARTDLRKKVQQAARSVLPNETEAPIVVTANARAWRHFIEMRASSHAEIEIRELAVRAFLCLQKADPVLFDDYVLERLSDGTYTVKTEFQKV